MLFLVFQWYQLCLKMGFYCSNSRMCKHRWMHMELQAFSLEVSFKKSALLQVFWLWCKQQHERSLIWEQAGNVFSGRKLMHHVTHTGMHRVFMDGERKRGVERFNLKRWAAIRLGWLLHGGNNLRCLSTINIFLICALLLTSKITSKWIAHY